MGTGIVVQEFQYSTQGTGKIINQTKKHLSYEVGRSAKTLAGGPNTRAKGPRRVQKKSRDSTKYATLERSLLGGFRKVLGQHSSEVS